MCVFACVYVCVWVCVYKKQRLVESLLFEYMSLYIFMHILSGQNRHNGPFTCFVKEVWAVRTLKGFFSLCECFCEFASYLTMFYYLQHFNHLTACQMKVMVILWKAVVYIM